MKKFNNFSKKFVLGTAQLCEKYGYFNKSNTNNKKAIKILDSKNRKEKNTIKRTGAFHNQNFRDDLTSLLMGEVDLYEVKYHIDWWYYINQFSTALSRKGVSSSLIKQYKNSDSIEKPKGTKRSVLLQNKVFH